MAKATEQPFTLVPTRSQGFGPGPATGGSIVPLRRSHSLVPRLDRVEEEYEINYLELQRTGELALFGQEQMGRVSEHGEGVFVRTSGEVLTSAALATDKEHQRWVQEYTRQNLSAFGRHMLGLQEAADFNIAQTVSRTLYAPPPRPRTFWEKLFNLPLE